MCKFLLSYVKREHYSYLIYGELLLSAQMHHLRDEQWLLVLINVTYYLKYMTYSIEYFNDFEL